MSDEPERFVLVPIGCAAILLGALLFIAHLMGYFTMPTQPSPFRVWLRGALRSKTVRLAIAQAVLGILAMPVITPVGAAVVIAKSAADVALRSATKESLQEKAAE